MTESVPVTKDQKLQEYRAIELQARNGFNSKYRGDCRNVGDAVAKILYGRELGIPPMESLQKIYDQDGRLEPDYTLVLALVYRNFPGTVITCTTPLEERRIHYRLEVTSPQRGNHEAEVKIQDFEYIANRQRNPSQSPWKRHPERMLMSKAVKLIADMVFTDVVTGSFQANGPLRSQTRLTLEEWEAHRLSEKPKIRENVLTESQNERKQVLLKQAEDIDEHERLAQKMEAEEKCTVTLQ